MQAGREAAIRPCVGASYCIDRIYEGNEALCIHNPATGREASMPQTITPTTGERRRVVVVGAGPAGLEAARVSAERGHQVVVFEAAERPGGQILLAARHQRRRELIGIVDWRVAQLEQLGVAIRTSRPMPEPRKSRPRRRMSFSSRLAACRTPIVLESGADLVVSTWDVASGQVAAAERVLVFDDNGNHPAMQAAEMLAERGAEVELVTPERMLAPEIGGLNHAAYARVFQRRGREDHGQHPPALGPPRRPMRSSPSSAAIMGRACSSGGWTRWSSSTARCQWTNCITRCGRVRSISARWTTPPCWPGAPRTIVRNPAGRYRLFRIGDAIASRNIHAAIFDALRLAKDL